MALSQNVTFCCWFVLLSFIPTPNTPEKKKEVIHYAAYTGLALEIQAWIISENARESDLIYKLRKSKI